MILASDFNKTDLRTRSQALILGLLCLLLGTSCSRSFENGYTDKTSYFIGDRMTLFLNSERTIEEATLKIVDINHQEVSEFKSALNPQIVSGTEPYKNGFGYNPTAQIQVPDLKSGVYLIDNKIPFIVKAKRVPQVLILYSSNTENAYENSGGKSLYNYNSSDKIASHIVSNQRPIGLPKHSTQFLEWISSIESEYEIGYLCDADMDEYSNLDGADLLIIPGHSEYWTRKGRENFDRFVSEGNNALILSGNTMWWQVRYSKNGEELICYKDFNSDPIKDRNLKTVNWSQAYLNYSISASIGLDFDQGGYGKKEDKGWDGYKLMSTSSSIFDGVDYKEGDVIHLPTEEFDGAQLLFSKDSSSVSLLNQDNFLNYELYGYDLASRRAHSNGAWIALQKTKSSGVILNTGSTDWCAKAGMEGKDSDRIKHITLNMIELLTGERPSQIFTRNKSQ